MMRLQSPTAAILEASCHLEVHKFLLRKTSPILTYITTDPRHCTMFSQILFSFLTASLYLCNATPLTSPSQTLFPRDAVTDCQNVTRGLNESCWDIVPRNVGMKSWMNTWNSTTTTCKPGEAWANCFMREANVTTNSTEGIRCDLIGPDTCPAPSTDVLEQASVEVAYGVVSIWGKQGSRGHEKEKNED